MVNPGQVEPGHQIAIELFAQQTLITLRLVPQFEQLAVAWIAAQHTFPIDAKKERQQIGFVLVRPGLLAAEG